MHFREGVRLALLQIKQEKLKSAFSLLGVIIGVIFLIVVVSVVEGMDRYITDDLAEEIFGINTIQVRRVPQVQVDTDPAQRREWRRRPRLTLEDAEAIRAGLSVPALVGVESGTSAEVRAPGRAGLQSVRVSLVSPGSEVSRGGLSEDRLVQLGIGQQFLQPGVLFLQVFEPFRLIGPNPAVFLPPTVVGLIGDP